MSANLPHVSRSRRLRPRGFRVACASVAAIAAAGLAAAPAVAATAAQIPGGAPFAGGTLVSRSGSTLDVQGPTGDTKVIVTSSTKYRATEVADASAVTVGACVRVVGTGSTDDGIVATSVSVSDGSSKCTDDVAVFRGGGPGGFDRNANGNGSGDGNANRTPPSTIVSGSAPEGRTAPGGEGFGLIAGKVTSVSGDTVVVKGKVPKSRTPETRRNPERNTKRNSKIETKTKKVTVTLPTTARVTRTVEATADALAIGACVNAAGKADSVGTVTAETVTVSAAENGSCAMGGGFGPRPGGRGEQPAGPGGTGSTSTPTR